ncbi:30S ribosomal protein S7 [Texas Phoenix palm phytoplasma]|uniref:Small ribosomal subunit protein uS7 n=1 Tax=Texas Phoenix palm phytoplasma TaxID=176709 RepID=A0ABS5BIC3_9MOLU|nr:30S ribosomal protein S7 [Texas Phoenix palm phytoplasma]MBP3059326.1 30S ribosomal protein S7 [Texas Phoenix palm phytoplasma]
MSRKKSVYKRDISSDTVYNSQIISKTINAIMKDGKKSIARTILYSALKKVKKATNQEAIDVFNKALNNIMPILEVRNRAIGSQNYQIPSEVLPKRRQSLGLRWLIQCAKKRNEKTMIEKLAKEIIDASLGTGLSIKKKEDMHRMAEANKAFAYYRYSSS